MLHSDLKVVKHQRLQAVGGKKCAAKEYRNLGEKREDLGARWGTKPGSCKCCSNIILRWCYLLNFNLFCLAKPMYFKGGQKSDHSQVVSTTILPFQEVETP